MTSGILFLIRKSFQLLIINGNLVFYPILVLIIVLNLLVCRLNVDSLSLLHLDLYRGLNIIDLDAGFILRRQKIFKSN